jgi:hypothetical protein
VCTARQSNCCYGQRNRGSHAFFEDYHIHPFAVVLLVPLELKFPRTPADIGNMENRRCEGRMLCADMIDVQWTPPGDRRQHCATAILEDISPSGACLQLELEVPVGSRIYWKAPNQEFAGRVRYCVFREIGYFVGVEFAHDSKWSESVYLPEHLFDVNKLLRQAPPPAE